jgi:hypothetical protein
VQEELEEHPTQLFVEQMVDLLLLLAHKLTAEAEEATEETLELLVLRMVQLAALVVEVVDKTLLQD